MLSQNTHKIAGCDATALDFALVSLRSILNALRNHLRWPALRRSYDAHPRAFSLVDESVCAKFVFYFGNSELSTGHPLYRGSEIAGPDAPRRTVLKFNDVRLAVLSYKHRLGSLVGLKLAACGLWLGGAPHGLDQVEELPVLIVFVGARV